MHRLLLNTVSIQHSCRFPNTENTMVRSTTKMLDRNSLFLLFFFIFFLFSFFFFFFSLSFSLPSLADELRVVLVGDRDGEVQLCQKPW